MRVIDDSHVGLAFGEPITKADVAQLLEAFGVKTDLDSVSAASPLTADLRRATPFMTHAVFNTYHSETMMLRSGQQQPGPTWLALRSGNMTR